MSTSRLEILRTMLTNDPTNAFCRYGLAMELVNSGDPEAASVEFAELLRHSPNYCAGYFHGGQTLEKLGRLDEARELYRRGIVAATAAGDAHTRSELEGALGALG